MGSPKPLVQAACICENVIFEKDDVPTVIRMVDIFNVEAPDNIPPGVPHGFPVTLFIRVKFKEGATDGIISIQPKRPDGTVGTRQNVAIQSGNHENVQIKTAFHVLNPQNGTYTFDVFWGEELLTFIPMQVIVKPTLAPGATRQT